MKILVAGKEEAFFGPFKKKTKKDYKNMRERPVPKPEPKKSTRDHKSDYGLHSGKTQAAIKGGDEYRWWVYNGPNKTFVSKQGSKATLTKGDKWGHRPSADRKSWRVVFEKTGLTKIFTLTDAAAGKLEDASKAIKATESASNDKATEALAALEKAMSKNVRRLFGPAKKTSEGLMYKLKIGNFRIHLGASKDPQKPFYLWVQFEDGFEKDMSFAKASTALKTLRAHMASRLTYVSEQLDAYTRFKKATELLMKDVPLK